jgi:hypothetical protein
MRKTERSTSLHESDVAAWSAHQAAAIRERRWGDVDVENVAEEIESLGVSQRSALHSRMRRLLRHLLKLLYQPEHASSSWHATVIEQRARISRLLRLSPSLKPLLDEVIAEEYPIACELAAVETGLPSETFPAVCRFTVPEVLQGDRPRPL